MDFLLFIQDQLPPLIALLARVGKKQYGEKKVRELTSFEMQHVSGAGFFDFVGAVVVGAVAGTTAFGLKWAMSGGSTGGIVGAGILAGGVGLIVGAVVGLVDGALYGAMNGWDATAGWFNQIVENQFDPVAPVITA